MDSVVGFPRTRRQNDFIWVVVDRLTKSHFILIKSTHLAEYYAKIFINEILYLHGIPLSIYRIGVHNSHLGSGGHSKKDWVLK